MTWHVSVPTESYEVARDEFSWAFPDGYNAATDFLRKHERADDRIALSQLTPDGIREEYTFGDLDRRSNRVANALRARAVSTGATESPSSSRRNPRTSSRISPAGNWVPSRSRFRFSSVRRHSDTDCKTARPPSSSPTRASSTLSRPPFPTVPT